MKKIMLLTVAFQLLTSSAHTNETYMVEVDTNGVTRVTGTDGCRRVVIMLEPEHYMMLTGRLERVWQALNSTEDGRKALHGARVRRIVDEKTGIITMEYADGYRSTARMAIRTSANRRPDSIRRPPVRQKPGNISTRQWKARLERENKKPSREVTVEFAPGGIPVKEIK